MTHENGNIDFSNFQFPSQRHRVMAGETTEELNFRLSQFRSAAFNSAPCSIVNTRIDALLDSMSDMAELLKQIKSK